MSRTEIHEMAVRAIPERIMELRLEQAMAKRTHAAHWPVHARIIAYYSARMGLLELTHQSIAKLRSEGWSEQQLAKLFRSATTLLYKWGLFDWKHYGKLNSDERLQLAEWMAELVTHLQHPPYLAIDGHNRVWTPDQAHNHVKQMQWIKPETPEDRRLVGQLFGQLFNYTEMLFFAFHANAHDYHGLYHVGGKDYFFGDFFRLQSPLYPSAERFPYPEFRVGVQTDEYPFRVDTYQHLFANEPLPPHVRAIAITGGPKVESVSELRHFVRELDGAISKVVQEVSQHTHEEMIAKATLSNFIAFKELFDAAQTTHLVPWNITYSELHAKYGDAPPLLPPGSAENPDPDFLKEYWLKSISPL